MGSVVWGTEPCIALEAMGGTNDRRGAKVSAEASSLSPYPDPAESLKSLLPSLPLRVY
jgi:hypothetical protein